MRERIAGVAQKIFDSLKTSTLSALESLGDRENEIAMPLLAIAEVAGDDWPERIRRALTEIFTSSAVVKDESIGVRLLKDIRRVFEESESQQISTAGLLDMLRQDDQSPWCEFSHGKPLSSKKLAKILSPYGISSDRWREGKKTLRGYSRSLFRDAWSRYCPSTVQTPDTPGTSGADCVFNHLPVPDKDVVPDVSDTDVGPGTAKLFKTNTVPDVPHVPLLER